MKKINWSKVIEWVIFVGIILGLLIGGIEYFKHLSTFQALVSILFSAGCFVLGIIVTKWYARKVKKFPW